MGRHHKTGATICATEGHLAQLVQAVFQEFNPKQDPIECSICMIKFGPTEKSEIGVCGHIYHTKCIDQYRTAKLGKTKLQSELELIY